MTHSTPICAPIYRHPLGPNLMTVEILPAELPRDASKHFSRALGPYLGALVGVHAKAKGADISKGKKSGGEEERALLDTLKRATIAEHGVLGDKHAWLMERVEAYWAGTKEEQKGGGGLTPPATPTPTPASTLKTTTTSAPAAAEGPSCAIPSAAPRPAPKKRILLLGSGMVAKSAVDLFLARKDVRLVVGEFRVCVFQFCGRSICANFWWLSFEVSFHTLFLSLLGTLPGSISPAVLHYLGF